MKQIIFSIYDSKAGIYASPFFDRSEGQAIRNFVTASESQESQLNKFPMDFSLYKLGTYEDTTGSFELETRPVMVYALSQNIDVNTRVKDHEISDDTSVQ